VASGKAAVLVPPIWVAVAARVVGLVVAALPLVLQSRLRVTDLATSGGGSSPRCCSGSSRLDADAFRPSREVQPDEHPRARTVNEGCAGKRGSAPESKDPPTSVPRLSAEGPETNQG
jgi:hypothetical protein